MWARSFVGFPKARHEIVADSPRPWHETPPFTVWFHASDSLISTFDENWCKIDVPKESAVSVGFHCQVFKVSYGGKFYALRVAEKSKGKSISFVSSRINTEWGVLNSKYDFNYETPFELMLCESQTVSRPPSVSNSNIPRSYHIVSWCDEGSLEQNLTATSAGGEELVVAMRCLGQIIEVCQHCGLVNIDPACRNFLKVRGQYKMADLSTFEMVQGDAVMRIIAQDVRKFAVDVAFQLKCQGPPSANLHLKEQLALSDEEWDVLVSLERCPDDISQRIRSATHERFNQLRERGRFNPLTSRATLRFRDDYDDHMEIGDPSGVASSSTAPSSSATQSSSTKAADASLNQAPQDEDDAPTGISKYLRSRKQRNVSPTVNDDDDAAPPPNSIPAIKKKSMANRGARKRKKKQAKGTRGTSGKSRSRRISRHDYDSEPEVESDDSRDDSLVNDEKEDGRSGDSTESQASTTEEDVKKHLTKWLNFGRIKSAKYSAIPNLASEIVLENLLVQHRDQFERFIDAVLAIRDAHHAALNMKYDENVFPKELVINSSYGSHRGRPELKSSLADSFSALQNSCAPETFSSGSEENISHLMRVTMRTSGSEISKSAETFDNLLIRAFSYLSLALHADMEIHSREDRLDVVFSANEGSLLVSTVQVTHQSRKSCIKTYAWALCIFNIATDYISKQ